MKHDVRKTRTSMKKEAAARPDPIIAAKWHRLHTSMH